MTEKSSNQPQQESTLLTQVVFFVMLSIMLIGVFKWMLNKRAIKNDLSHTLGIVTNPTTTAKGGLRISFKYDVDGRTFNGNNVGRVGECRRFALENYDLLIGKEFVVAYEKSNPQNSTLLLFESQYEYYKLEKLQESKNEIAILSTCE